jgi:CelD/BcsL family acetyltransferase involved in cellulose biosynthesis
VIFCNRILASRVGGMKISVLPAKNLPQQLIQKWSALQQSNPDLVSPFFCPEFTSAVATVRSDVSVGVLEEGNEIVGFFPFQRVNRLTGRPVGWPMCDYQGLIAGLQNDWDAEELMKGCGLSVWDFDHLIASQSIFWPFVLNKGQSLSLNLSDGYDAYTQEKKQTGSRLVERIARQVRRLERNVGTVRFETHLADHGTLDRLLAWWAAKWRPGGRLRSWSSAVLHNVLDAQTDSFGGVLAVLYAGNELVALDFGMRSRSVWHSWFPAYNQQFARYSPGLVLLMRIAATAPSLGIKILDLGPGESAYKKRLANHAVSIAQGTMELPSLRAEARHFRRKLEGQIRQRPLLLTSAKAAATAVRVVRRKLMIG